MKKVFQDKYKILENDIDELIESFNSKGEQLKDARNKLKIFELKDFKVNIKSFKVPNIINQIVYGLFRKGKARRSFEYANKLLSLGIGTPNPIAYYEDSSFFLFKKSYYVSEQLKYDLTFRELDGDFNYPNHEKLLRAFTRFTFELHQKGINFLDHSPGNTLIKIKDSSYDFYLVDLNRMKFESMPFEKGVGNFARLTKHEALVKVMSDEYAKCVGKSPEEVFRLMWQHTQEFRGKIRRKKAIKNKLKV